MFTFLKKIAYLFIVLGLLMIPYYFLLYFPEYVFPELAKLLEDGGTLFGVIWLIIFGFLLFKFFPILLCFGNALALFQVEKALNELDALSLTRADTAKDAANAYVAELEQAVDARLSALEEASQPAEHSAP